jgi:hypothetical protein
MLVECSQHFRKAPKVGSSLTTRQIGQSKEIKDLAWRMQNRLHKRYVKLKARGKNENKAIVAVARELSAFIWELQVKLNLPIPGTTTPATSGSGTGTKHGAAAPDPAEPRQLDPISSPLNPPRGTSPLPSPRGGGGKPLKKPTHAKRATT